MSVPEDSVAQAPRPVVVLDTNSIIDLEEARVPRVVALRELVAGHERAQIELVVSAITASENAQAGKKESFDQFRRRLERVGLADARVLPPMGYWSVTFWGQALWVSPEMQDLEERIHLILAPGQPMRYASDRRRWINTKCDVQLVWTHLWHKTAALVTGDGGILRKADALSHLGATILSPRAAADALDCPRETQESEQ